MPKLAAGLLILAVTAPAAEGGAAERQGVAGRRIYETQCASCHGVRSEGARDWREPNRQGEMPAPPHDSEGHTWKHADGMLYEIVKSGWRDRFNKTQRLTMPAFGQTLSPMEIRAVIDYLKSWWTPEQRRFQEDESRKHPHPPKALD